MSFVQPLAQYVQIAMQSHARTAETIHVTNDLFIASSY